MGYIIDKGELQSVAPADSCPSVTYSKTIGPIISNKCSVSGCHDSGSLTGDFTAYDGLKVSVENGNFKRKVLDLKTMPVSGSLSIQELQNIQCWLDQGHLNN